MFDTHKHEQMRQAIIMDSDVTPRMKEAALYMMDTIKSFAEDLGMVITDPPEPVVEKDETDETTETP
jgi:hypothetical protein